MKSLVAISGEMTSGKTTVSNRLIERYGYERISIATPMKQLVSMYIEKKETEEIIRFLSKILADPKDALTAFQSIKEHFAGFAFTEFEKDSQGEYIKTDSYRAFIQLLGKTVRSIEKDAWLNFAILQSKRLASEGKKVIFDDLRLKNEKAALANEGFALIRLDICPEEQNRRLQEIYGHVNEERKNDPTEQDLRHERFDLRIDNSYISLEKTLQIIEAFLQD